jgi:hypothetical protein
MQTKLKEQISKLEESRRGTGDLGKNHRELQKEKKLLKETSNAVLDTTGQQTEVVEKTIDWTKTLDNQFFDSGNWTPAGGISGGDVIPIVNNNNDGSVHNRSSQQIVINYTSPFSTDNLMNPQPMSGHS